MIDQERIKVCLESDDPIQALCDYSDELMSFELWADAAKVLRMINHGVSYENVGSSKGIL